MNKGLYKSSVDKINFDEQLEEKTLDYINKRGNIMKNTKKSKWKMKMSASTVAAACTVCVLSATAYAAINLNKVSHNDYGLVSKNNVDGYEDKNNTEVFKEDSDTNELRAKMDKENVGIELISEEKNVAGVSWSKKSIFRDKNKIYSSDDKINWIEDKEVSAGIITRYTYDSYEKAMEEAGLPNIMSKLINKVDEGEEAYLEEYSNENSSDINKKGVIGNFAYKKGKVSVDLSKYSMMKEGNNSGYSVITGIEKATNQREYQAKSGTTFKLSDNIDGKITKTTTMISSGDLCLILQFESMSDEDIYTILDKLDLSGFSI